MGLLFSSTRNYIDKGTSVNFPKEIKVTEKRAPTDESIKLWDEYRDKARASIISSFHIKTDIVNIIAVAFCDHKMHSPVDLAPIEYRIKYSLNGTEEVVKFKLDAIECEKLRRMHPKEADNYVIKMIFEKVSRMIAIRMLKSMDTKLLGLTENYNQ